MKICFQSTRLVVNFTKFFFSFFFALLPHFFVGARAEAAIDHANSVSGAVNTSSNLQQKRASLLSAIRERALRASSATDAGAAALGDGDGNPVAGAPRVSAARRAAAEAETASAARLLREQVAVATGTERTLASAGWMCLALISSPNLYRISFAPTAILSIYLLF